MIQIRFKDIDPDTGQISQDRLICSCEDSKTAEWVKHLIERSLWEDGEPNREVYVKQEDNE